MLNYTLIKSNLALKALLALSHDLLKIGVIIASSAACFTVFISLNAAQAQTASELKTIDSTLKQSEITLKNNQNKRDKTLQKIESIEKQITERTQRFEQTLVKVAQLDEQATQQSTEKDVLQNAFDRKQARLALLVESAYLMGRQSGLKVVLSQHGTQHISRLNHYAKAIADARQNQLASLSTLQTQLDHKTTKINAQRAQLGELTSVLEEDQRYLKQLKTNRLAMVADLDHEIDKGAQSVELLRQRKAALEKVLARISKRQKARAASALARQKRYKKSNKADKPVQRKNSDRKSAIVSSGKLPMPVKAKIVARFGQKRAESGLPWSGILMEGREGSDILAISAGEVVYADWLQGYGQMVIVDHGGGVMSLYGHNKSIYKAVGDRVRQSDIIATMGNTAGLKKAALYFEIRQNGVAQDPLKWCRI